MCVFFGRGKGIFGALHVLGCIDKSPLSFFLPLIFFLLFPLFLLLPFLCQSFLHSFPHLLSVFNSFYVTSPPLLEYEKQMMFRVADRLCDLFFAFTDDDIFFCYQSCFGGAWSQTRCELTIYYVSRADV